MVDIIDVSSSSSAEEEEKDNDDCLIISRSDAVSPPRNNNNNGGRKAVIKKEEDQVALFSAAAAAAVVVDAASSHSHNKRSRRRSSIYFSSSRAKKKKEWQSAAELDAAAAAAYYKKCRVLVERKKKAPLITVDKKIPAGILTTNLSKGKGSSSIRFNMHKSLAHKKVLLYGLPGYQHLVAHSSVSEFTNRCEQWRPFFQNSFMMPVLDFIKHADYLKKNGVDETVFFSVNGNGLMFAFRNEEIRKRHKYVTMVTDYANRYLHALGMEMDIPQEGMPPRSRKFILLVDNLKVKFARIESSDGNFTIPSNEEIIKAFDQ